MVALSSGSRLSRCILAVALAQALAFVLPAAVHAQTAAPPASDMGVQCAPVAVHRFTNLLSQSHFLTIADPQRNYLQLGRPDFRYEGIAYYAYASPTPDSVGVWRLYNATTNSHFYTTSDAEKALMIANNPGITDEGYDHYVPKALAGGAVEVFRFMDSNRKSHLFAVGATERDQIKTQPTEVLQTTAFYAFPVSVMSGPAANIPASMCDPIPIHRFLNKNVNATFLTPSEAERKFMATGKPEYQYLGIAFYAAGPGASDSSGVYRFYDSTAQSHFYTTSDAEKAQMIASAGPTSFEGLNFSVAPSTKAIAAADLLGIYRIYNTNTRRYLYAVSTAERDTWLKIAGAKDQGICFSARKTGPVKPTPGTNQKPVVSLALPATVATAPADVVLQATASDPDGTVAKVEFFNDGVKIGEATAAPYQFTWQGVAAGTYTLSAVATDNQGAMTTSATGKLFVASPAVVYTAVQKDAARFLTQATFGMKSTADVADLASLGYENWLNTQFSLQANSHVQYVNDRKAAGDSTAEERAYEAIWQQWLLEPGQLRARVSFALSEIFVISNIAPDLNTYAMASYMDMLNRNAFGNYRQLLEDVTLHPAMGYYLNMNGSKKADPVKGTHPNENYAREVMQLFTIGLVKLNPDGTRQIGGDGLPVPTYDQTVVQNMAAAFSGWSFAGNNTADAALFDPAKEDWLDPMQPWPAWHDTNAKTIFNGIALPAGQTAQKDMKDTLDALFNHPNVGPFVGRELIQRLVTSNPSPAYIGRVAAVFANNDSGVRGDLKAVVRAVLLDPEARDLTLAADPKFGKQREPVIRFANFLRGLGAKSTSGRNKIWYLDDADTGLGQSPLLAPSVFNFFSPNYRQPGALAAVGLVAPEFQITTETSMVGQLNFFAALFKNGGYGSGDTKQSFDFTALNTLAADPSRLIDQLNLLLLNGNMSQALRNSLVGTLGALPAPKAGAAVTDRVRAALIMISLSPEYAIQK